jgi:hypothetical protein
LPKWAEYRLKKVHTNLVFAQMMRDRPAIIENAQCIVMGQSAKLAIYDSLGTIG